MPDARRADELWQQGFDSMQRQEYAAAVRFFQQALVQDRHQGAGISLEIMLYLAEAYKLNNQLWLAAAIGFQSISNFSFALNVEHPD